jgi:hypothetical protein
MRKLCHVIRHFSCALCSHYWAFSLFNIHYVCIKWWRRIKHKTGVSISWSLFFLFSKHHKVTIVLVVVGLICFKQRDMNSSLTFCIVFKRFLLKIGKKKKRKKRRRRWLLGIEHTTFQFRFHALTTFNKRN